MDKLASKADLSTYKKIFHFLLIALLISIIYSNTLGQEWHFDDYPNIVEDKTIHLSDITFDSVWELVTTKAFGLKGIWRPISRLTFGLNYYFNGLNTLSFHLTNIVIHFITAIFVYLVFQKTLMILKGRGETAINKIACEDVALLGALLWAIHPMQTQAVTYIVQRMASLAAMFYIMGIFFYIKGRVFKNELKTILYYCASIVCCLLAALSKENAIFVFISIILYEIIFFGISKKKIYYIIGLLVLFFIAAAAIVYFTQENSFGSVDKIISAFKESFIAPYAYRPFTMTERLMTEFRILVWYIFLIICPIADFLALESDISVSTGLFQPLSTIFSIIVLVALFIGSLFFYKKFKLLSFAILFFFVNHIVESSFIGLELYFEHRNYLSSIFIYLMISYILMSLYVYYINNNRVAMQYIVVFFMVCVLVSEGNATYLRNDVWSTEETLHLDNINKSPDNIRPRISLSSYYMQQGKFEEAIDLLRAGEVIVNSGLVRVQKNWIGLLYHNLGAVYYRMSELDKAKINLLKSIEYNQNSWETHLMLGMIFFTQDNIDQSVKAFSNAVTLNPSDAKLFNMFGRTLYAFRQYNAAIEAFNRGLELAQQDNKYDVIKTIHFNLIACYIAQEDFVNAKRILLLVEKNYDYVVYKYSVYSEYLKQPLQEINVYSDIIYHMYKLILYPEDYNESLNEIAVFLSKSDKSYCEFIKEVEENKYLGIIYPSIHDIKIDLSKFYNDEIDRLTDALENKKEGSPDCPSDGDTNV